MQNVEGRRTRDAIQARDVWPRDGRTSVAGYHEVALVIPTVYSFLHHGFAWDFTCIRQPEMRHQLICLNFQIKVKVEKLLGKFKVLNKNEDGTARPSALYASGDLCTANKKLGLASRTPFAESDGNGASWGASLDFPIKARLPVCRSAQA